MDLSRPEVRRAPPAVDIDVEELVLIGFPPINRHTVARALGRTPTVSRNWTQPRNTGRPDDGAAVKAPELERPGKPKTGGSS